MHGEENSRNMRKQNRSRIDSLQCRVIRAHIRNFREAHDVTNFVQRMLMTGGLEQVLPVFVAACVTVTRLFGRVRSRVGVGTLKHRAAIPSRIY